MANFPVDVQNQFTGYPSFQAKSNVLPWPSQGTLSSTVATINAATGFGTQILSTSNFPLNRSAYVRGAYVSSNVPTLISLYVTNSGNSGQVKLWVGPNYFNGYLPINNILQGGSMSVWANQAIGLTTDSVVVNVTLDIQSQPLDITNANKKIRFYGDSITNGFSLSNHYDTYQRQFANYLRLQGKSIALETIGINGTGTKDWLLTFNNGLMEEGLSGCAVAVIALGVNDCNSGSAAFVSAATYKANLKLMAQKLLACGENKTLQVILISASPLGNSTSETNAVAQRATISAIVSEIGNSRLNYIDFGGAYTGSNTSYSGDGIHPTVLGHSTLFTGPITTFLNSANGIAFVNSLS
jgi:hypothetical protein